MIPLTHAMHQLRNVVLVALIALVMLLSALPADARGGGAKSPGNITWEATARNITWE